jgi:hypothetical protein
LFGRCVNVEVWVVRIVVEKKECTSEEKTDDAHRLATFDDSP